MRIHVVIPELDHQRYVANKHIYMIVIYHNTFICYYSRPNANIVAAQPEPKPAYHRFIGNYLLDT